MSMPQRRGRRGRLARETALAAFIISSALAAIPAAAAEKDPVFTSRGDLAIRGYDPVAYFTDAFTVVNGKLYLNYNRRVMRQWLEDRDRNIEQADENWPAVLEE